MHLYVCPVKIPKGLPWERVVRGAVSACLAAYNQSLISDGERIEPPPKSCLLTVACRVACPCLFFIINEKIKN